VIATTTSVSCEPQWTCADRLRKRYSDWRVESAAVPTVQCGHQPIAENCQSTLTSSAAQAAVSHKLLSRGLVGDGRLVTEATVSWSCCSTVSLAELRSRGFDDEPTWFAAVTGPEWRNGPNSKRNSPTNVVGNKRRRQQTSSANKPREQLG